MAAAWIRALFRTCTRATDVATGVATHARAAELRWTCEPMGEAELGYLQNCRHYTGSHLPSRARAGVTPARTARAYSGAILLQVWAESREPD